MFTVHLICIQLLYYFKAIQYLCKSIILTMFYEAVCCGVLSKTEKLRTHYPLSCRLSRFSLSPQSLRIPCKPQRSAQQCLQCFFFLLLPQLRTLQFKGDDVGNSQCGNRSGHATAEPCAPQFWTLNAERSSQLNRVVFISRAFMSTRSGRCWKTHTAHTHSHKHTLVCSPLFCEEKRSFVRRRGSLPFSGLSPGIMCALFTYVCVHLCMCVCVCSNIWVCAGELQSHYSA